VAELLLAGPQYRQHDTIRLAVAPGGIRGVKLPVAVEGTDLVWDGGRTALTGTIRQIGDVADIDACAPEGLYEDGSGTDLDEPLEIDASAAATLWDWFGVGDQALRSFDGEETPVLWPEHFDLGISVDEVNYGISPGDANQAEPYAYVGPWTARSGTFWNAPFGAIRLMSEAPSVEDLTVFFDEGRRQTSA
jgi:hypothetical protein